MAVLPPVRARPHMWAGELAALVAIVVGCLAVRLYLAASAETVSRDTCLFVWYAQGLPESPRATLRAYDQHPLYPLSVWATHALLASGDRLPEGSRGWERAATAASMTAGMGAVLLIWLLTRHLFGRRIGLIGALFAALYPELARCSADGLSDPIHLFFYLAALLFGATGLSRASRGRTLAAGVCAGLAYLARPEGAGMGLALILVCVVAAKATPWRTRLGLAVVAGIGFALPATPYMLATGKLVQKKPVEKFLSWPAGPDESAAGWQPGPRVPEEARPLPAGVVGPGALQDQAGRYARAFLSVLWKWVKTCRVVFFLLAVVGFVAYGCPAGRQATGALVTAAGALHFLVLILLVVNFDYHGKLSVRHTLVLAVLPLPWAAAAAEWIVLRLNHLRSAQKGEQRREVAAPPWWWWVAVALALTAPTSFWLLRHLQPNTAYLRSAGEWLAANRPRAALVMTTENRVPFYAGKNRCHWPEENGRVDELLAHLDLFRPDVLVLDLRRATGSNPRFPDQLASSPEAARRLRRIASFAGRPEKRGTPQVILFDVIRASSATGAPDAPQ